MEWVSDGFVGKEDVLNDRFISAKPFPHIVLDNFFSPKIKMVKSALLKEKFYPFDNDLFQFVQTDDIKNSSNERLREFHRFFSSKEFVGFVSKVTGSKLDSKDMSGFVYSDTDYLLPHDDRLEGRKIAYVVNLGSDFNERDGGALQLFKGNKVVRSYSPKFNSLVLFKVSPKSVHQVQEVISKKKRISLAGWFHG